VDEANVACHGTRNPPRCRPCAALYDELFVTAPSPVVELHRAIAIAMRDGTDAG
jgi:predicted RNA polymerase sigma factor